MDPRIYLQLIQLLDKFSQTRKPLDWGDSNILAACLKKKKVKSLSCVQLFETLWIVAYQAPPFMESSRQEYWSGLLFPSRGNLPDPGIKAESPTLQEDTLPSEPPGKQPV